MTRVAVLGGGLAGCCTAIALAEKGCSVTIYDRQDDMFKGASFANEGKIHLGYVYAGDRSLATARRMILGALTFEPLIRRYLGAEPDLFRSTPFFYGVHRQSQKDADEIAHYLNAVSACILEAMGAHGHTYFGADVGALPYRLSATQLEDSFDPALILAAFQTPEVAIEPEELGRHVRARVADDPRIAVTLARVIGGVEDDSTGLVVVSRGDGREFRERYTDVVNALWDGRLRIDATRGLYPARKWLHRLKYGVRFDLPEGFEIPSVTIVLGPFGDTVAYGDRSAYLSWYPSGMTDHSLDLSPPPWPGEPDRAVQKRIVAESLAAFAVIIPSLGSLDSDALINVRVKGGAIVAWGETDIDDRGSGLHERRDIGVASNGRYHSIDTGKLTTAPYFASVCAERILSG